jgi:hypothetical protein
LYVEVSTTSGQRLHEISVAVARCPHLEVLSIPRIVLPPAFVASMAESSSARSDPDAATPSDGLNPSSTGCRVDAPLLPSPHFAPYAAKLRWLELSHGLDNTAEFAFIATQLPSLRCLVLASARDSRGRLPTGVWRRGLRQLLRQLHKLYIESLSRPLCRALNTLHALAAADAQRSTVLRLLPGGMSTILQSDPDETESSGDDSAPLNPPPPPADIEHITTSSRSPAVEDILPLQVFSIYGFSTRRPYSIAPFVRYLGQHAPLLTEVGLSRTTADTAAELITLQTPCRALELRDTRGLTDTIVAFILKQHRATLRQILVANVLEPALTFDPRAYMEVLGDKDTPQGAPFTKILYVGLSVLRFREEHRAYFSYLLPALCEPHTMDLDPIFRHVAP